MGPFIDNLVISGEFDLTGFRFVPYTAVKPQSATFHNEVKFNQLVKTIGAWCQFDQNSST